MQPELPLARSSDPIASHQTVASIKADTGLAADIIYIVRSNRDSWIRAQIRSYGEDRGNYPGLQDDDVVDRLEAMHGRRFQRNVVARARGLLEHAQNGQHIVRRPSRIGRTGRLTITYTVNPDLYPFTEQPTIK